MAISNTPSPLSNIVAAKTYNAAWFSGSTKELQITNAIVAAKADGALYVYVPSNMLPYNPAQVTFQATIRMIREGGNPDTFDVKAYGAAGDNVQDDSAAIQAALNGSVAFNLAIMSIYASGKVWYPLGVYRTTIPITIPYVITMEGEARGGVQIRPSSNTFDVFTFNVSNGYLTTIKNLYIIGGKRVFVLFRGNDDVSMNVFEDVWLAGNDPTQWGIDITAQSSTNFFHRMRVISCPKFLKSTADQSTVYDSWINGYDQTTGKKPTNTASYEAHGRLYLHHNIHVSDQSGTGQATTRWIDAYDSVFIDHDHFGGEAANDGYPIIYGYINDQAVTYGNHVFSIKDSQTTPGFGARADNGVIVFKDGIPNRIHLQDINYVNGQNIINASQMQVGGTGAGETIAAFLAREITANTPAITITLEGIVEIAGVYFPTELQPYIYFDLPSHGAAQIAQFGIQRGTCAMQLNFGGAHVGMTGGGFTANWVKRGDKVRIDGSFTLTAKGASVGNAAITGLPFPVSTTHGTELEPIAGYSVLTSTGPVALFTNGIAAAFPNPTFYQSGSLAGGNGSVMTDANFANTTSINFVFEYSL